MTEAQFALTLIAARAKLAAPRLRRASAAKALFAAALAAASALGLAIAVILGPGVALADRETSTVFADK